MSLECAGFARGPAKAEVQVRFLARTLDHVTLVPDGLAAACKAVSSGFDSHRRLEQVTPQRCGLEIINFTAVCSHSAVSMAGIAGATGCHITPTAAGFVGADPECVQATVLQRKSESHWLISAR